MHAGLVGVNILLKGSVQGTVPGLHGDYILGGNPGRESDIDIFLNWIRDY